MTSPEYLDPVREELDRLRAQVAEHETDTAYMREGYEHDQREIARLAAALEQAEARVEALTQELATVRDTLRHRSNALNATGTHNDQLRAQLARVEKQAADWERMAEELKQRTSNVAANARVAGAFRHAAKHVRAALADKEPTP